MKPDKTDLRILAALQRDGRLTKSRLAEIVNLSAAACWERLRRLEASGIIAGYTAVIDRSRFEPFITVLVQITLKSHRQADFQRFEAAVAREPGIVGCDALGGGIDYMLRVEAADIDAYQRLIDRLLVAEIGIDRYFTYIVTKRVTVAGPQGGPLPAD